MTDQEIYEFVSKYYGLLTVDDMWRELQGVATYERLRNIRKLVREEKKLQEIPDEEVIAYIKANWKTKKDKEIAQDLGVTVGRINVLRRKHGLKFTKNMARPHLCWTCKKATSAASCIYVASCIGAQKLRYYDGAVVKHGIIVKCPNYEEG